MKTPKYRDKKSAKSKVDVSSVRSFCRNHQGSRKWDNPSLRDFGYEAFVAGSLKKLMSNRSRGLKLNSLECRERRRGGMGFDLGCPFRAVIIHPKENQRMPTTIDP
jgi:hypothetical protein